MQPIRLYFASGKNSIPGAIVLGEDSEGRKAKIKKIYVCKHHMFRGKSGSRKSYLLALYIMELQAMGYRVIFIDPLEEIYNLMLHWYSYFCREAYLKGQANSRWFSEQILPNILSIDLSQKDHPFRHNMFKPFDAFLSGLGNDAAMDCQLQRRSN